MGSRIALHCLGPQQSWKPGNLSWASRWGCPQLWGVRGGHHLWARLGGAMGRKGGAMGAGLAPSTSLGWDLAWQHRAWPAAAGTEGGSPWKGVSLRSGWVCAEVAGRAVVPEGRACQGVGCLDGTMSRILGELRVPGCGSGLAPGRFWGGGGWSPSHSTCWNVAPWIGAVIFEPLLSLVYQATLRKSSH